MSTDKFVNGLIADSLFQEFRERLNSEKDTFVQALGRIVRRNVENIALLERLVHDMNAQVQRQAWEIYRLNEALDLRGQAPPCGTPSPDETEPQGQAKPIGGRGTW